MPTRKGRVKVRGTCPEGHVTETTSAPGRVTWEGDCANKGCSHTVKARRVPRDRTPEPTGDDPAPVPPDDATHEVREVSYDVPPPRRKQPDDTPPAPASEPTGEPGGKPAVPAGQRERDPEPRPTPEPDAGPDGGGERERPAELVGRRRRRRRPLSGLRFRTPLDW